MAKPSPNKSAAKKTSSSQVPKIAISLLILLVAAALGGYTYITSFSATSFADLHGSTDGTNPVLRYLADGEIKAKKRKQEEERRTIFHEKKAKHVPNDTLPPSKLTKTSSSSRGVVNFNISGKVRWVKRRDGRQVAKAECAPTPHPCTNIF